MRGRKTIPTARKRLEGNPGKRKLNEDEPKPEHKMPEKPAFLSGEAGLVWDRFAPDLYRLKLLTAIDGAAFAAACMAYSRWLQAEQEIDKHGLLIDTPIVSKKTGEIVGCTLRKNPACVAARITV